MKKTTWSTQTILSQPLRQAPQYIKTIQPPVFRASTIIFPTVKDFTDRHWTDPYDYSYGTHGTPTTYSLADQIKQLEGADFCLLAPSGLSAINIVNTTLLNTGDEVWIPDNIYGPNREHLHELAQKYGIICKVYSPTNLSNLDFSAHTKLIWIEAAGSVTLEFPDLCRIITLAQKHGVLTAIDNTWGAGLAFCAFDIGKDHLSVDISVHALTKYPSGGGDILMGSICTKNEELHHKLLRTHALQGISISGDDAAQISRSLCHMQLRYQQHHLNTLQVIDYLSTCTHFTQILHPSIEQHAGHQHWKDICPEQIGAGIVSVIFNPKYKLQDIQKFCDALQLFRLGFSWGGPTSLVMYYQLDEFRTFQLQHIHSGILLRFCIGLEQSQDLISDIQHALYCLD